MTPREPFHRREPDAVLGLCKHCHRPSFIDTAPASIADAVEQASRYERLPKVRPRGEALRIWRAGIRDRRRRGVSSSNSTCQPKEGAMPTQYFRSVTDERIEAALAKTDITPELVEWYGSPDHRITLRIETHIGRYAEAWLTPWMDDDALVFYIQSAAKGLSDGA